jgi:hydroxylamine reductase (hybrid-cluster protein)
MKERLLDAGSCLLAVVLSVVALAAVAELAVNETPVYGELKY